MQFSDTTNYTGLIQAIEEYTDLGYGTISGDDDYLKRFTNYINRENRKVAHDIFTVYNGWVYDDGEQGDLPQATADLTSGTYRYALPSDAMAILRIEIKDNDGNWHIVKPYLLEQTDRAVADMNTKTGRPTHYRLLNNAMELYPKPNYSETDGIKVYFTRTSVDFDYDDTTQSPGFEAAYHDVLALGAAIQWLKIKQPNSPTLKVIMGDYIEIRRNLRDFYAERYRSFLPHRIRTNPHNFA